MLYVSECFLELLLTIILIFNKNEVYEFIHNFLGVICSFAFT